MKKSNGTVCSGEIYFIDGPKMMKGPGVVINNDKRPLGARTIWANRPGVVITSDEYNKGSDDVFVVFLTKRTYNMEDWYKSFSPRQTDVQCSYETYTALCSEPFPKKRTVKTEKKRNENIEMRDREIKLRRNREKLQSVQEAASREQNGDAQSCRRPPGRQIRRSVPRRGYGNA